MSEEMFSKWSDVFFLRNHAGTLGAADLGREAQTIALQSATRLLAIADKLEAFSEPPKPPEDRGKVEA